MSKSPGLLEYCNSNRGPLISGLGERERVKQLLAHFYTAAEEISTRGDLQLSLR